MRKTPLAKSFAEINSAKRALQKLKQARTIEIASDAWTEAIGAIAKTWTKAAAEYKGHPKFNGWNSEYVTLLQTDELLRYVKEARNADEHTIQDSIGRNAGGFRLNPVTPGGTLYIKKLEISGGNITHLDTGGTPFRAEIIAPHPELVPFKNRGVEYMPPNHHEGVKIDGKSPVIVLELAIRFYENYLQTLRDEVPLT